MPKKKAEKPSNDHDEGLLYPFLQNGFSKGVLIALVPAIAGCVIARAPQFRLNKILGQDLPISFDAISLILAAPIYFLTVTWLLLRTARRSGTRKENWSSIDGTVLGCLVALLGMTAIFMLAQFFLILAPVGTCDQRPHLEMLWSFAYGMSQISHCMSTATEINKTAWYYVQPVIIQAWANIFLVGLSLRFLWQAWNAWLGKAGTS